MRADPLLSLLSAGGRRTPGTVALPAGVIEFGEVLRLSTLLDEIASLREELRVNASMTSVGEDDAAAAARAEWQAARMEKASARQEAEERAAAAEAAAVGPVSLVPCRVCGRNFSTGERPQGIEFGSRDC